MLTLIQKKLPKYVNAGIYDIQVMTPMRKGLLGVERLNQILQQYLNPPSPEKSEREYADRLFREGDKVMQIKIIISWNGKYRRNTALLWIKGKVYLMETWVLSGKSIPMKRP